MREPAPVEGPAFRRSATATGVAGLATLVLVFVPIIARSGQEPAFTGTPAEILTYFGSIRSPSSELGSFSFTVGMVAFLWFVVGLASLVQVAEGELPWRSRIAVASGVVVVALTLQANWDVAVFRVDGLDPQVATYAFDQGNLSFANAWVALGSFAVCTGWVIAATGLLPRWLGWWAIVSGGGLVLGRVDWTGQLWFLPYAMFWLWVIVVSVLLVRGRVPGLVGRFVPGAGSVSGVSPAREEGRTS